MDNSKQERKSEDIIHEVITELLAKMNIGAQIETNKFFQGDKESLVCNIQTEESNYLIGQYGVNLQALQHIARLIVRKKTEDRINFLLDVNSYRQEKNQTVSQLAKSMADKALLERRAVVLRPMSPYERRLVHMELSRNEQIKTESIGEGEDRRVVIKPADLI